ncbi:hypothetical protein OKW45_002754 [Paraburkholderia sp. WSM4175]|uniref:hypothetical protein n=1 Tax=Paraburkholderia sp. WSM4175 TaxID=2991072 RepID=UPI003D1CE40A
MEAKFRSSDDILRQLVTTRREEVVRLQRSETDHLKDMETRGQARIADLRKTLPTDMVTVLDTLDGMHSEAEAATKSLTESIKAKLVSSKSAPENETTLHPGLAGGHLVAPNSLGWFTPYYGTLHGSDGTVYWQGYNPGNIDLSDSANGSGSGIFGTGAASFTVYMDWWFSYKAPEDRNYAHTVWVPFHGFSILYADDGFWDSKEAHARIDMSAVGYQYNYKATGSTDVFDMDSQNINVNDRFDGWRTMYYSDLLGADQAYLRVTASFYVYARGGGSNAQLNFSDGDANYIGVPWVYIN